MNDCRRVFFYFFSLRTVVPLLRMIFFVNEFILRIICLCLVYLQGYVFDNIYLRWTL